MKIECNHHVVSFNPTRAKGLSTDPLKLPAGEYTFEYRYPLRNRAKFKHTITSDTNAIAILSVAKADYQAIYDAEDAACGPTANIPGMLNRQQSEGPYGIWGHDMSDLYFEEVEIDPNTKLVTFCIGS